MEKPGVGDETAACCISSPPYAQGLGKEHTYANDAKRVNDGHRRILTEKRIADPYYGATDGNLGNMPLGCVVSSPPYAGAGEVLGTHNGIDYSKSRTGGKRRTPAREAYGLNYGDAPENLGNMPTGTPPPGAAL